MANFVIAGRDTTACLVSVVADNVQIQMVSVANMCMYFIGEFISGKIQLSIRFAGRAVRRCMMWPHPCVPYAHSFLGCSTCWRATRTYKRR